MGAMFLFMAMMGGGGAEVVAPFVYLTPARATEILSGNRVTAEILTGERLP